MPWQPGDVQYRCWARIRDNLASTRQGLTALSDSLGLAIRYNIGRHWRGASIDNVIRFTGDESCEWVLLDMTADGVHNGVGPGLVRLYSESGTMLAVGSQSFVIRELMKRMTRQPD